MGRPAGKKRSKLTAYNNWGYFFVAPFVIVFCIFSVYPVLRTLYLSFTDLKVVGDPNFIWFENYRRVITDKFFWKALGNTVRIWIVNIILQLGLAFLLMMVFSDVKNERTWHFQDHLLSAKSDRSNFHSIPVQNTAGLEIWYL